MTTDSVINTEEAAALLARLVACPSVNPTRGVPAGPPFGEGALADLLGSLLSEWGAETQKVEFAPGRFNFLARFEGASSRRLMLEAHADTVPIDGMTIEPFSPVIRDGKLFGRGSCDTKGSMAAMLLAIRAVLDADGKPPATVYFVATGDEEVGSAGAHQLVAGGFRAEAAVVGEPTGLAVVRAHKGAYRFRVVTHGRAAHSSDPSLGSSAISRMTGVVQALEGRLAGALRVQAHPDLGSPTVSVGVIRGGSQVNIVPARCEIEVDCRTLPGERGEDVRREVRRLLDPLGDGDPGFRYSLEELEWYPAFQEDPQGRLVDLARSACQQVLGRAELAAVPWASNAGVFHEAGIPCVVFGPGSVRQAHTADEHIELGQVVEAAKVYARILRAF